MNWVLCVLICGNATLLPEVQNKKHNVTQIPKRNAPRRNWTTDLSMSSKGTSAALYPWAIGANIWVEESRPSERRANGGAGDRNPGLSQARRCEASALPLSYTPKTALLQRTQSDLRRDRTCNLLIRSQAPCHWASRPFWGCCLDLPNYWSTDLKLV